MIRGGDTIKLTHEKTNLLQYLVPTRHENFYTWMMFGWRKLLNNYPSYVSVGPLTKIELGRWIPKALSLEDFISKQPYYAEKKLSGNKPTWKYYCKTLFPDNKELHISHLSFYPKFEFYNGVKYSKILPNYSTYFSNQEMKIKESYFSTK